VFDTSVLSHKRNYDDNFPRMHRCPPHRPAPRGSYSCCGRWRGSRAASRCSSTSPACPRSGRGRSWPGPRTRSRLRERGKAADEYRTGASWESCFGGVTFSPLTRHRGDLTLLAVGVRGPGPVTVAVEGPLGVDAAAVGAQRLVVAFVDV